MKKVVRRTAGAAAAAALTVTVIAGCSDDNSNDDSTASDASMSMSQSEDAGGASESESADSDAADKAEVTAADGSKVTLTGAIAKKYTSATEKQKSDLGKVKTGDDAAGKSDNGVVFQQFEGGVITAKSDDAPAYITWGKIRDAWNVKRDDSGKPDEDGKGGSTGPLGVATSDETDEGSMKVSTFENGKITFDPAKDKVEVTVDGKVVPTE
ncbi:LGFP repeat-containing protein [Gordonia shandongensis]|uniref:LGFP repeat-containing protein n=1 Tax=Gordonia shandongensis TaxID=376351 RepID=UPI000424A1B3|nr:hypothetical protein [Gordonia shandongensis]